MQQQPWWQHCVFYQIYPRSFADGNHDGVGDLEGIIRKLDYLSWLGIEAIWLSPIYPSPMKDGGYDIQDYCDISPLFGTLQVFDHLISEAHRKGIKVILDWVPNHTSDQHPWFIESRSSKNNPKRNWYIWRDEPNNWQADIERGSAWTLDPTTNQYYLHSYLPQQPDLNWSNPEVVTAMLNVLRFWLDRGVDGFRCDVINMIAKDMTFADWPADQVERPHRAHWQNEPTVHPLLQKIRAVLDSYPHQPVLIGELKLEDPQTAQTYYGHDNELELVFNFRLIQLSWDAPSWKRLLQTTANAAKSSSHWPSGVLGDHDNPRVVSRYGSTEQAAAAAVLLLTLPGSPFIYAGDELGLADAPVSNIVDPGGRDGSRAPIPWNASVDHGWPVPPVLPFPANVDAANYQREADDHTSMLTLYRQLISIYQTSSNLQGNDFELLETAEPILAFRRGDLEIVVNFGAQAATYNLQGAPKLILRTKSYDAPDNELQPYETVIFDRAASAAQ